MAARNANVHLQDCELTATPPTASPAGPSTSCRAGRAASRTWASPPGRPAARRQQARDVRRDHGGRRGVRLPHARPAHRRLPRLRQRGRGASGAGGFLYAVRSAEAAAAGGILGGGEAMWVDIEGREPSSGRTRPSTRTRLAQARQRRGRALRHHGGHRHPAGPRLDRAGDPGRGDRAVSPGHAAEHGARAQGHDQHEREQRPRGADLGGDRLRLRGSADRHGGRAGGRDDRRRDADCHRTGFEAGARVLVGATSVAATFVSATELEVTSPPACRGTVDVIVVSPSGARATLANALELAAP